MQTTMSLLTVSASLKEDICVYFRVKIKLGMCTFWCKIMLN